MHKNIANFLSTNGSWCTEQIKKIETDMAADYFQRVGFLLTMDNIGLSYEKAAEKYFEWLKYLFGIGEIHYSQDKIPFVVANSQAREKDLLSMMDQLFFTDGFLAWVIVSSNDRKSMKWILKKWNIYTENVLKLRDEVQKNGN